RAELLHTGMGDGSRVRRRGRARRDRRHRSGAACVPAEDDRRAEEARLMVPVQYNARSLLVRKTTTLATAGRIALVVFVFAGALMLREGVNRAFAASGRTDTVVIVRKGSDAELSSAIGNEYLALFRSPAQVSQSVGMIGEIVVVVIGEHADGSG